MEPIENSGRDSNETVCSSSDPWINVYRLEPCEHMDGDYNLVTDIESLQEQVNNVIEQWADNHDDGEELVIKVKFREMKKSKYDRLCEQADAYWKWMDGDDDE